MPEDVSAPSYKQRSSSARHALLQRRDFGGAFALVHTGALEARLHLAAQPPAFGGGENASAVVFKHRIVALPPLLPAGLKDVEQLVALPSAAPLLLEAFAVAVAFRSTA